MTEMEKTLVSTSIFLQAWDQTEETRRGMENNYAFHMNGIYFCHKPFRRKLICKDSQIKVLKERAVRAIPKAQDGPLYL